MCNLQPNGKKATGRLHFQNGLLELGYPPQRKLFPLSRKELASNFTPCLLLLEQNWSFTPFSPVVDFLMEKHTVYSDLKGLSCNGHLNVTFGYWCCNAFTFSQWKHGYQVPYLDGCLTNTTWGTSLLWVMGTVKVTQKQVRWPLMVPQFLFPKKTVSHMTQNEWGQH